MQLMKEIRFLSAIIAPQDPLVFIMLFRDTSHRDLDIVVPPETLKGHVEEISGKYYFRQHFGFQLECKSCKKFFVNAALNPLRNSTQHREDSLRRRNIEILVDTLLENEWIYHKFRRAHKREFDQYIWKNSEKNV